MNKKTCSKCRQQKSLEEFHKNRSHADGHNWYCKVCATQASKKWYKENIHRPEVKDRLRTYYTRKYQIFKGFTDKLKGACGCAICGEEEPCCLDFHHVFGQKEKDVSFFIKTKNVKKVIEELKKCICVCSNCHRKIHAKVLSLDSETLVKAAQVMYCSLYHLLARDAESFRYNVARKRLPDTRASGNGR